MTKHTITLPEPVTAYIDGRLADGRYASLSEYVSDLVVQDMARQQRAADELRVLLDDGENSGLSPRSLDEIFDHARSSDRKSTDRL